MYTKILAYAVANGKTHADVEGNVDLQDNSDGNGPFISAWNVAGLAEPTQSQLNAISQADADAEQAKCAAACLKEQKIALKMRIDAGNAIGEDMSAEQAELDAL